MDTTLLPARWRAPAFGAALLVVLALSVGLWRGLRRPRVADGRAALAAPELAQAPDVVFPRGPAVRRGGGFSPGGPGPGAGHAGHLLPPPSASGVASRETPDLLADWEGRVGPVTAARLRGARDAGRAFAERLHVEGPPAQGIADALTQLALDVARAEQGTTAGSDGRTAGVQRAAQSAIDALRHLVPDTALPQAEQEIRDWTGDVPVTFSYPPLRRHGVPAEQPPLP